MSDRSDDSAKSEEKRLGNRKAQKLTAKTQRIEVQRGNAWISLDNEDILLEPGESITLRSSDKGRVISATGRDSMVFSVSDVRKALEDDVRLETRAAQRLDNKTQKIEIKRGNAWVSVGDEDIVLKPGETFTIRSSTHGGVISATGNDSMVFSIKDLKRGEADED
jgi:uncharacterized protein with PhoU and TrkA domain